MDKIDKYFQEIPHTKWAIEFYINSGEKALKQSKNKIEHLDKLIAEAKRRLEVIKNDQIKMS